MTDLEHWIQDAGGGQGQGLVGSGGTQGVDKQHNLGNNKTAVLSSVVYPTGLPIEYRLPHQTPPVNSNSER